MKRWCQVYVCGREAEPDSSFCELHGWNQPKLPQLPPPVVDEEEETVARWFN